MNIFFPILEKNKEKEGAEEDKRIPLHIYNVPQEPIDNLKNSKKKKSNNDLYIDVNKEFDVDFTLDIFWDCYEYSDKIKHSG